MNAMVVRIVITLLIVSSLGACRFEVPPELASGEVEDDMSSSTSPDASSGIDQSHPSGPDMAARDALPDMLLSMDQGRVMDMAPPRDMAPLPDMNTPPVDMSGEVDQGSMGPVYQICGGTRVDVSTSAIHCGECDRACEGGQGVCVDGMCACPWSGGQVCGEQGECRDTLYDPRHCGGCDVICDAGEVCAAGSCECRPGLTRCGDACVDTTLDPRHCGMCGNDCGEGNRCKASQCGESQLCGIGYTGCRRDRRVACVKDNVDSESDLYCRPGPRFDVLCGEQCSGNEVCFEPDDLINPIQCRPYRPARECDRCPCDACRDDEVCRRQILGVDDVTYCVRRP